VKEFLAQLTPLLMTLYVVLAGALLVQLFYYLGIYFRPVFWKKKLIQSKEEPVTVIICAKNEASNLVQFLPKILEQDYPEFEVVVVNDCSEDDTETVLAVLKQKYTNLRYTTIEPDNKFIHGKKLAITIGLKSAQYNRVLFTDADCYPASNQWIREMNLGYSEQTKLVLGYGAYQTGKTFLNRIVRFDTFFIAMQYMGLAIAGKPYMGVGRNLSYLKDFFFSHKGFTRHYSLISGDDDLFVNENGKKKNTSVVLSHESFTYSVPPQKFGEWAKQKKRHLSTGHRYKASDKFVLGTELLSRFLFYSTLLALSLTGGDPVILLSAFGGRFIIQMLIVKLIMNKLGEKGVWLFTPFLDIILPIIHLYLTILNRLNAHNTKWT